MTTTKAHAAPGTSELRYFLRGLRDALITGSFLVGVVYVNGHFDFFTARETTPAAVGDSKPAGPVQKGLMADAGF